MKCVICKQGHTSAGVTTLTLERGQATVVFKNVPAQICDNCGEAYVDDGVARSVLSRAENAAGSGVKVEVLSYAA